MAGRDEMNREQRRAAEKSGTNTDPTPEQQAEARRRWETASHALRQNTLQAVFEGLEAHKKQQAPEPLQHAAIAFALNVFAGYLKRNKLLKEGDKVDAQVALALTSIPAGAADALRRIEDRRIIVPGR